MSIVSNASPLINLVRIGQLNLLRQLYNEIVIPEAVWREVVIEGSGQPGADELKSATWVKTQTVKNQQLVHALRQDLDAGEAEAIVLAVEHGAELLLMDERLGRESASHFNLRITGVVGVLVEAKRKGFIQDVKSHLVALRDLAGFHLSEQLYQRILQDENEA